MTTETLERPWEDVALALLLAIVGGGRVALALAEDETFGAQPSIALIALALAFVVFPWRKPCST